jgi:hypothetical protein
LRSRIFESVSATTFLQFDPVVAVEAVVAGAAGCDLC